MLHNQLPVINVIFKDFDKDFSIKRQRVMEGCSCTTEKKWCSWHCSAENTDVYLKTDFCLSNDWCINVNSKYICCMLAFHRFSTEVWGSLWDDRWGGYATSAVVHIRTGMAEIYFCCLQVWCLFHDGWQVNFSQLGFIHQLVQFPGLCCRIAKIPRL